MKEPQFDVLNHSDTQFIIERTEDGRTHTVCEILGDWGMERTGRASRIARLLNAGHEALEGAR